MEPRRRLWLRSGAGEVVGGPCAKGRGTQTVQAFGVTPCPLPACASRSSGLVASAPPGAAQPLLPFLRGQIPINKCRNALLCISDQLFDA